MDDDENQRPDVNKAAADNDDGAKPTSDAPRPLSDVAKDHDDNAGSTESTSASSGGNSGQGGDSSGSGGPQAQGESHGEGTGEMWVKTTGFAADGGDFDASKPGAGREADREFLVFSLPAHIPHTDNLLARPDGSQGPIQSGSAP